MVIYTERKRVSLRLSFSFSPAGLNLGGKLLFSRNRQSRVGWGEEEEIGGGAAGPEENGERPQVFTDNESCQQSGYKKEADDSQPLLTLFREKYRNSKKRA